MGPGTAGRERLIGTLCPQEADLCSPAHLPVFHPIRPIRPIRPISLRGRLRRSPCQPRFFEELLRLGMSRAAVAAEE